MNEITLVIVVLLVFFLVLYLVLLLRMVRAKQVGAVTTLSVMPSSVWVVSPRLTAFGRQMHRGQSWWWFAFARQCPEQKAADLFSENDQEKGEQSVLEKSCAVCLEPFDDGHKLVRQLPCGHVFHAACIDPWAMKSCFCPLCRQSPFIQDVACSAKPKSGTAPEARVDEIEHHAHRFSDDVPEEVASMPGTLTDFGIEAVSSESDSAAGL